MKNFILIAMFLFVLGACASFGPNPDYYQGMKERKFLRQNKEAVISSLDGNLKTYRITRDERFYILATFESERLIRFEERELAPMWMDGRPVQDSLGNRRFWE